MNKTTAIPVLVLSMLLSSTALSHSGPHNGGNQNLPMYGGAGMMSDEDFDEMYEHMEEMQALMRDASNEKNPKKHTQLMQEHWRLMQKNMNIMNPGVGMMNQGNGMRGGYGQMMDGNQMPRGANPNAAKPGGTPQPLDMDSRMHRIEERMGMMQMLMEQFMKREAERERLPNK